jgi:hypothetical protein
MLNSSFYLNVVLGGNQKRSAKIHRFRQWLLVEWVVSWNSLSVVISLFEKTATEAGNTCIFNDLGVYLLFQAEKESDESREVVLLKRILVFP